ncbi:MAG: NupC/NupG family nucleoside CNT transporter [Planctomycetes bacterium]|nr:NupC/NupG family nucleoside CNT transporter [Planctomycetota bacterium]MCB9869754.1 NupC/NupG family nucleoside CNT transporter [Planctomycetota bacterium]
MLRLVSLSGVLVILAILLVCSKNRRAIRWRLVGTGLAIQLVLGLTFLSWQGGRDGVSYLGDRVKEFLGQSAEGTKFIFGPLADFKMVEGAFTANDKVDAQTGLNYAVYRDAYLERNARGNAKRDIGFVFATQVLPTLIFFSSFMAVLYYLGIMQRIVQLMAAVMARLLGTSGSESLSACGNIFVGQTEAPLMVKPYLPRMTQSEIHAVMTGGYCTIAGGVFALYVAYGVPAGHLMVASVMAVPAGLVCTKMMWPETEASETMGKVVTTARSESRSVVEAAASGAADGLKLALNVGAMLIAFLGLVAVINWGFSAVQVGGAPLTLERMLGWLFFPVAAVMGVQSSEIGILAELLGKKIVLTELLAYKDLGPMIQKHEISPRTGMIASFALCGFANLGSIAIQIGGLSVMAPGRQSEIATLAVRAMWTGALATCMTACVAGALGSEAGG